MYGRLQSPAPERQPSSEAPSTRPPSAAGSNAARQEALGLGSSDPVAQAQVEAGAYSSDELLQLGEVLDRLVAALGGIPLPATFGEPPDAWSHDALTILALDRCVPGAGLPWVRRQALLRHLERGGSAAITVLHGWFRDLSADEVQALLQDPSLGLAGHEDQLLALLPAVTRASLLADPQGQPLAPGELGEVDGPLFDGAEGGPKVEATDVRQGGIGDCWLLSALASLAARDPAAIAAMIQPDGEGWRVRLFVPEGPGQPRWTPIWVGVDAQVPVDADGQRVGVGRNQAPVGQGELWPALVEKAVARLAGSYTALETTPFNAWALLTGTESANHGPEQEDDAVWTGLLASLSAGRPAGVGLIVQSDRGPEDHAIAILDAWEAEGERKVQVYDQAGWFHRTTAPWTIPWTQLRAESEEIRY